MAIQDDTTRDTAPQQEDAQQPQTPQENGAPDQPQQAAGEGEGLQAEIAAVKQKLEEAQQQASELKTSLLRTAAEYENYRKRSQKEHDTAFNNGVGFAAFELLPVLDTLQAAANAETSDPEYKKGVILTLAKCEEVFSKLGITEIEAEGAEFNPELHNAVMQEAAEGAESGIITRVIQKGYIMGDRVIRHSMVAVAP